MSRTTKQLHHRQQQQPPQGLVASGGGGGEALEATAHGVDGGENAGRGQGGQGQVGTDAGVASRSRMAPSDFRRRRAVALLALIDKGANIGPFAGR